MAKKQICKHCHYCYERLTYNKAGVPLGTKAYCAHWGMYDAPELIDIYKRDGKAILLHESCDRYLQGWCSSVRFWPGLRPCDAGGSS